MKIVKFYSCCHFEDVCIYCLACFRYYLFVLALGLEVDMGELRKEAHIEIVDEQKSCRWDAANIDTMTIPGAGTLCVLSSIQQHIL